MISLLKQQPLIVWTGDSQQTPGGIARAAPNAKRSRQLLLAKKHGLRSDKNYYMPSTLADAMRGLLNSSSNDSLIALAGILHAGDNKLGKVWTDELPPGPLENLRKTNEMLPGVKSTFEPASPEERARCPSVVDPDLLEGSVVNFQRSLVRLAWILQHTVTLLPMASLQATLNSETSGVANLHAWGLVLPSSSRVSPVTYHSVVAVRYPMLCRQIDDMWELGSFASGGVPNRPPFFWTAPSAFRLVTNFEAYLRTSGESNHHRKSVRVVERHRPTNFTTGAPGVPNRPPGFQLVL